MCWLVDYQGILPQARSQIYKQIDFINIIAGNFDTTVLYLANMGLSFLGWCSNNGAKYLIVVSWSFMSVLWWFYLKGVCLALQHGFYNMAIVL